MIIWNELTNLYPYQGIRVESYFRKTHKNLDGSVMDCSNAENLDNAD